MRELEDMLQKEREARELAEDLARRLEESATAHVNGSVKPEPEASSIESATPIQEKETVISEDEGASSEKEPSEQDVARDIATSLQSRIDTMDGQMQDLREQLEQWKQRCETAESERDESRKSLTEMVVQLRAEEAKRVASEEKRRSRSRRRRAEQNDQPAGSTGAANQSPGSNSPDVTSSDNPRPTEELDGDPTLSRANTITPLSSQRSIVSREQQIQAGLPYASMLGVVLIGMGLMAYINGWQSPPAPRIER